MRADRDCADVFSYIRSVQKPQTMPVFQSIPKESYDPSNPAHSEHTETRCTSAGVVFVPYHLEALHAGLVVTEREANYANDSDWYATVYDPKTDTFFEVQTGTTRHGWIGGCQIDAPPELIEKWNDLQRQRQLDAEHAHREAKRLEVAEGKAVRVVKGRKVPVGIEGTVFWCRPDAYGGRRAGIKTSAGEVHWTSAANLAVI